MAPMARRPPTTDAGAVQTGGPADSGCDEPERGPLRRCVITRERLPRETMLRFVVAPDRRVVPDLAARLPGRGIWLSARRDVLDTARAKGAFARAARGAVTVPPDLLSGLIIALERRIGDHIGLARRAGQAVSGFEKAREWLETGRAALVIQAADGSPEERARFMGRNAGAVPVVQPLAAAALGAVFGRERAVHVAVSAGRLAEGLRIDAERLAGLAGRRKGRVRRSSGPNGRTTRRRGRRGDGTGSGG